MTRRCIPLSVQTDDGSGISIEKVPGVAQKPFCKILPHEKNPWQAPLQYISSQKMTWPVANRHLVPGALMHAAPVVIVVQGGLQTVSEVLELVLQKVTVTKSALSRRERGLRREAKGSPINVI